MTEFQKRFAIPVIVLIFLAALFSVLTKPASAVRLNSQIVSGVPISFQEQYPSAPASNVPLTVIDGKIGHQPVYTELVSRGVTPSDVLSLTRSFKGVFDFRNALPKD